MAVVETFDIMAFRSRQHALQYSQFLKNHGFPNQLMSTPKEVMLGCGLSLRFSPYLTPGIIDLYKRYPTPIIGFYHVRREGNKSKITRIPHEDIW